jgi:formate dehydrogenase major subunit
MVTVMIDGSIHEARGDERLIDLINRTGTELAQVCYHPQLGPIQTCDTCLVETNGRLVRACGTNLSDGMTVLTKSVKAGEAQRQAFDRILSNHLLYCTVCDKNNGNCTVHNTESLLAIEHQAIPFHSKPYEEDHTNPFYRYDPQQCILCGRCVDPHAGVQGGFRQYAGAGGGNCRKSAAAHQLPIRSSNAPARRRGGTEVEPLGLQSSGQQARTSSNEIRQFAG